MTRLAVVGAGYVGLVNAACLAELGHHVAVVEASPERLAALRRGEVGMLEPGLEPLVRENQARGRLAVTDDYAEAARDAEYAFIAVNTPVGPDGHHDLRNLWAAADSLAPVVASGSAVVILSTVPPGTTDALGERLEAAGRQDVSVAVLPEFFQEGSAVQDAWNPPRVIVGCRDRDRGEAIANLWRREDVPILLTDPPSAELSKLASNSFLAAKVSFINEIADHAARVGADITQVAEAMGLDPRIGSRYLSAGIGFGGSCLPKDLEGLATQMRALGGRSSMLDAVREVNSGRPAAVCALIEARLGRLEGARVALLGIAFKPGTGDRRDSASIFLARVLAANGCAVRATDPTVGIEDQATVAAEIGQGVQVTSLPDALDGADVVVLATEWPEYAAMDWGDVAQRIAGRLVVDGRNAVDPAAVCAAGLDYAGMGREA